MVMERASYCCDSAVRGYHIYQDIWEANYGESLSCMRETGNVFDSFACCICAEEWGHGRPCAKEDFCNLFVIFVSKWNHSL